MRPDVTSSHAVIEARQNRGGWCPVLPDDWCGEWKDVTT